MLLSRWLYRSDVDNVVPSEEHIRFRQGRMTRREKIGFVLGLLFQF